MRSVADGARGVENDLGRGIGIGAVDGGVDASELRGNEGEDGGAASGDAVLGEEDEEIGQEVVEALESVEVIGTADEFGSEIGDVAVLLRGGEVFAAETEMLIEDRFAAMAAAGVEVRAAGESGSHGGLSNLIRRWSGRSAGGSIGWESGRGVGCGSGHGVAWPGGIVD